MQYRANRRVRRGSRTGTRTSHETPILHSKRPVSQVKTNGQSVEMSELRALIEPDAPRCLSHRFDRLGQRRSPSVAICRCARARNPALHELHARGSASSSVFPSPFLPCIPSPYIYGICALARGMGKINFLFIACASFALLALDASLARTSEKLHANNASAEHSVIKAFLVRSN